MSKTPYSERSESAARVSLAGQSDNTTSPDISESTLGKDTPSGKKSVSFLQYKYNISNININNNNKKRNKNE